MTTALKTTHEITSRVEAEILLARIGDSMVALVKVFEDETRLVKAGKLSAASQLTPEKTELASQYLREIEILKANAPYISRTMPNLIDELRRAHAAFRDILALNLKVVATAQSVAESVVRGAAEEATRRTAPKRYSADGGAGARPASRPVIVSRSS
jgi:hypothetical protein